MPPQGGRPIIQSQYIPYYPSVPPVQYEYEYVLNRQSGQYGLIQRPSQVAAEKFVHIGSSDEEMP